MIKTGITDIKQLGSKTLLFKRSRKVSLPMVLDSILKYGATSVASSLFNDIRVGSTYKKTDSDRFKDIDHVLIDVIKDNIDVGKKQIMCDLAVSSGITSCRFYERLLSSGINLDFFATDKFTHLYCLSNPYNDIVIVVDANLNIVQFVGYGFVISSPESKYDVFNRCVLHLLERKYTEIVKKIISAAFVSIDEFTYCEKSIEGYTVVRYPLIDTECLDLIQSTKGFCFIRSDVFSPLSRPYDTVRAMNILNVDYFDEGKLSLAVKHILNGLTDGGIFIVGRSQDEIRGDHNVSIFKKDHGFFRHIFDINNGSEIKDIVARNAK